MSMGKPLPHDSAPLHVRGEARYLDDLPLPEGTLHLAFGLATIAHGEVLELDLAPVRAAAGVVHVLGPDDLSPMPDTSPSAHDEPLLAGAMVQYHGQPLFIVAARDHLSARRAARLAKVRYAPRKPILTIAEALAADSRVEPQPIVWSQGDAAQRLGVSPLRLQGRMAIGGQEHFYLEGQIAAALPLENGGMHIFSSTQHPTEIQHKVAHALHLGMAEVRVETRRMGGGFGGKESQGNGPAIACAVMAHATGRPCKLRYDRDDDMVITGKRHDLELGYDVGFDATGRIWALDVQHHFRCGWSLDLSMPVADRAMLHAENCYWLPDIRIESHRLRTHTCSATAYRGFGGPQGILGIERIIDHIAHELGLDPLEVRRVNFYADAPPLQSAQPHQPGRGSRIATEHAGKATRLEGAQTAGTTRLGPTPEAPPHHQPGHGTAFSGPHSRPSAARIGTAAHSTAVPSTAAQSTVQTAAPPPPARHGHQTTPYKMPVEDFIGHALCARLAADADYLARREAVRAFNATSPILKRGIALTPVKFGISFTLTWLNQAGALVHVYQDGSVHLNHGGTEMGQGLNQKVAQITAHVFGLEAGDIRITATDTDKVPNTSATAASSGTDLNGKAAEAAALTIRARLAAFLAEKHGTAPESVRFEGGDVHVAGERFPFARVAQWAWQARISLSSTGYYATPEISWDRARGQGRPFYYFAYGAAVTEVVIDTLTGENRILRTDILHDAGASLNPALDIGQIEGAYVQGSGWLTTEELVWNPEGRLMTHAPSTYKIPACSDRPPIFNVTLWHEPNRKDAVGKSKAVGEPPFNLGISTWAALSDAVAQCGDQGIYPALQAPATAEAVLAAIARVRGHA